MEAISETEKTLRNQGLFPMFPMFPILRMTGGSSPSTAVRRD